VLPIVNWAANTPLSQAQEKNMAKLTDTQLIVLSKAARREDGAAGVPPTPPTPMTAVMTLQPSNITLLPLPPKSPELNPVENIWQFMRDNWLSTRIFKSLWTGTIARRRSSPPPTASSISQTSASPPVFESAHSVGAGFLSRRQEWREPEGRPIRCSTLIGFHGRS
jgi:hypothetical protein